MLKPLVVAVVLFATAARADDSTVLLEQLIEHQSTIEARLERFFIKHQVKKPQFYAKILSLHPMSERKKKIMAAILVPESRGNAEAVNRYSGAAGPWQVMPSWKRKLNIKGSLLNPITNLQAASRVYDIHAKDAKYNERKTLAGYSGGAKGYPEKVLRLVETI